MIRVIVDGIPLDVESLAWLCWRCLRDHGIDNWSDECPGECESCGRRGDLNYLSNGPEPRFAVHAGP